MHLPPITPISANSGIPQQAGECHNCFKLGTEVTKKGREMFWDAKAGLTWGKFLFGLMTCALINGAAADATRRLNEPMRFTLHQECEGSGCGTYILASGTIVEATPAAFEAFLSRIHFRPTVYFHSPGGNLAAGIKLGLAVRRAGLDSFVGGPYEEFIHIGAPTATIVQNAICYSACAYAFVGGVTRELVKEGRLGVHQFRGIGGDFGEASAQMTTAMLATYLDEMGVDRRVLDIASTVTANSLYIFTPQEARLLSIDNTDPPRAPWRLEAANNGNLLLVVSQKQSRRDGVVHFVLSQEMGVIRADLLYQIRQSFRTRMHMKEIFSGRTEFMLHCDKAKFTLATVTNWSEISGGYRTTLHIPRAALRAMAQAQDIHIRADWANAMRDVDPSVKFGTKGLQRALLALMR